MEHVSVHSCIFSNSREFGDILAALELPPSPWKRSWSAGLTFEHETQVLVVHIVGTRDRYDPSGKMFAARVSEETSLIIRGRLGTCKSS